MTEKKQIEAMTSPCAQCPWRKSNQGKKMAKSDDMPYGWYSLKNLRRLWAGLRTGEAPGMTCHPTDKDNPLPEGAKPVPEGTIRHECAGSLLLVQRELRIIEQYYAQKKTAKEYLKDRRQGLSKHGVAWWGISRCSLANTIMGGPSMPTIEECPDIGYAPLEALDVPVAKT
jgi:hypothetical protein